MERDRRRTQNSPLRIAREKTGFTQGQLAHRMYVARPRVSLMETKDPRDLMVRSLVAYVEALGARLKVDIIFSDGTTVPVKVDRRG